MTIDRAEVEAALGGFPQGRELLARGFALCPVTAGALNRVVRVTGNGVDWAVRLAGGDDAALRVDRVAEQTAQETASRCGFAPPLIHADPARGVLVSRWIETVRSHQALLDEPAGIVRLASRLRALHEVSPPSGLRRVDADSVVAGYWPSSTAPEPAGPVGPRDLTTALAATASRRRSTRPAFCHNDLHLRNVLDDGVLWFIDWEYAGLGDPLFELAAVIGYHDLTDDAVEVLLSTYGGPTAADLRPWRLLFDVVHVLWLDRAGAWDSLSPTQREALIARLAA